MPILDAIPTNWFIIGTSVLAGVILFLILTQIPDDEEEKTDLAPAEKPADKPAPKSRSRARRK
jgi:hypothetical protein